MNHNSLPQLTLVKGGQGDCPRARARKMLESCRKTEDLVRLLKEEIPREFQQLNLGKIEVDLATTEEDGVFRVLVFSQNSAFPLVALCDDFKKGLRRVIVEIGELATNPKGKPFSLRGMEPLMAFGEI